MLFWHTFCLTKFDLAFKCLRLLLFEGTSVNLLRNCFHMRPISHSKQFQRFRMIQRHVRPSCCRCCCCCFFCRPTCVPWELCITWVSSGTVSWVELTGRDDRPDARMGGEAIRRPWRAGTDPAPTSCPRTHAYEVKPENYTKTPIGKSFFDRHRHEWFNW